MTPTNELYKSLELAYDHFNKALFGDSLPMVIFTAQRQQSIMGYFAPDRWTSREGKYCHEIAVNPAYVGRSSLIELLQTLVHEMTHCWQHCYGNPSRRSYHNKEWAEKMEAIGLMPSTNGMPGGAKTGEKMNDYPIKGGKFIRESEQLLKHSKFDLPWVDRFSRHVFTAEQTEGHKLEAVEGLEEETIIRLTTNVREFFHEGSFAGDAAVTSKKVKSVYICGKCFTKVWGKASLNIVCGDCDLVMMDPS